MSLIFQVVSYRLLSILFNIIFPNILQNSGKCSFLFFSFSLSKILRVFTLFPSAVTFVDIIKVLRSKTIPQINLISEETYCDYKFLSIDMENGTEKRLYKDGN